MHTILFRGKNAEHKWVYGYLIQREREYEAYNMTYKESFITNYENLQWNDIQVDTDSIGQYIGLRDKNGTKIFEGDIILTQEIKTRPFSKNRKLKRRKALVKFKSGESTDAFNEKYNGGTSQFIAELIDKDDNYCYWDWSLFYDCEIIGNKTDNPELLDA